MPHQRFQRFDFYVNLNTTQDSIFLQIFKPFPDMTHGDEVDIALKILHQETQWFKRPW